ncbi:MAG: hypothetical protein F6K30_17655 [Cyanothece sp. SIO2G6]|nr:hypothetical protein [Cyanothece sp. SIO2G6]
MGFARHHSRFEGVAKADLVFNGTDLRLVGSAHPTVYQHFQRSQFAYVSAIGFSIS